MTPPTTGDSVPLSLSHEEAWVAHAALLDAGEAAAAAGDDAPPQCRPLRRIERDRPLAPREVVLLRDALVDYLGDAPVRDRAPGRTLLRRVDDAVESRSASTR
ncbi:DUF7853 family protein [Halorubrum lipolyticum]|uniref:Uncharacterized protein n=1 Tax=Halorubrum lipolyticum DSM 21995 TaxID=1227482 RepID=M0NWY0_9EURY|nr:hypothetical protein [Halorubrum lipolyticum]EMA61779.1 hypothetical protein C469_06304 [Halorubrum lipolyticum DSM 21995]